MKKQYLIIGIVIILLASFFVFYYKNTSQAPEYEQATITLHRSKCYCYCPGECGCPVYSLEIDEDGSVKYEGDRWVGTLGVKTDNISPDKAKELVNDFYKINYFSLKDDYIEGMTYVSVVRTSLTIDGKSKTVKNWIGGLQKLNELENKIDEITNSDQWVQGTATSAVNSFLKARIQRNQELALSYVTENAKEQCLVRGNTLLIGSSNPHFSDFEILEKEELEDNKFRFKVRIYEEYTGQGQVGYFDEDLTLINKLQGRYFIDSLERGKY